MESCDYVSVTVRGIRMLGSSQNDAFVDGHSLSGCSDIRQGYNTFGKE